MNRIIRNYYSHEIAKRTEVHYPPCTRFAEIECKHEQESVVDNEAHQFAQLLRRASQARRRNSPYLDQVRHLSLRLKRYIHERSILRQSLWMLIIEIYNSLGQVPFKSSVFFTPNPLS